MCASMFTSISLSLSLWFSLHLFCRVHVGNLRDQHTTLMYRSWALIAFSAWKLEKLENSFVPGLVLCQPDHHHHHHHDHYDAVHRRRILACLFLLINFQHKLCGISTPNYKESFLFSPSPPPRPSGSPSHLRSLCTLHVRWVSDAPATIYAYIRCRQVRNPVL